MDDSGSRSDALLQPTVGQTVDEDPPWRLGSQVYVAFFGGVVAVCLIAWFNVRRLGLGRDAQVRVLAVAALGIAGMVAVATLVDERVTLAFRVVGLAAYGLVYLVQRAADRVHQLRSATDDPYDELLMPGLGAVVIGVVVQLCVAAATGDVAA